MIEDCNGLVIYEKYERVFGPVNVQRSRLAVVPHRSNMENMEWRNQKRSERKESKDIAKEKNAWKSFMKPSNLYTHEK